MSPGQATKGHEGADGHSVAGDGGGCHPGTAGLQVQMPTSRPPQLNGLQELSSHFCLRVRLVPCVPGFRDSPLLKGAPHACLHTHIHACLHVLTVK